MHSINKKISDKRANIFSMGKSDFIFK